MSEQPTDESSPSLLRQALDELDRVKDEPRMLVIITHGMIDLMVNTLIEVKCKQGKEITNDHRGYPHATKLLILNEMGAITDHDYRLLAWFNRLRNEFAHKPLFVLTEERLSALAKQEQRNVAKFADLCMMLMLDVWKSHAIELSPVFLPTLAVEDKMERQYVDEPAPKYLIPLTNDPPTIRRLTSQFGTIRTTYTPEVIKVIERGIPAEPDGT